MPEIHLQADLAKAVEEREYEVKFGQNELGSDIDFRNLPEDEFWVIGKTALPPAIMVDQNSQVIRVTLLPLREFRLRHRGIRAAALPTLWWMAIRIRSYLAYFCQSAVPIGFRFLGKTLVMPQSADFRHGLEVPASLMQDYLFGKTSNEEMSKKLESMYDTGQRFLSILKPNSLLDRAVIHAGDAFWARDPMDGFLQSWKAIEAVADMDFQLAREAYQRTLTETMSRYLEGKDLDRLSVKSGSVPKLARIRATIQRRAPMSGKVEEDLEPLRNAIAHGEVNPEKFQAILDRGAELAGLARTVIEAALAEFKEDMGDQSDKR